MTEFFATRSICREMTRTLCLALLTFSLFASAQEERVSWSVPIRIDFNRQFCRLRPITGPCEAAIRSWFFNSTSGRCEMFIYGGCGGNRNRFDTLADCQRACRDDCFFVNCFVDPCQMAQCDAFPEAQCVSNFCTGCDADFYMNGKRVHCRTVPERCLAKGDECQTSAGKANSEDVDATSIQSCCKELTCCACGPPVVTENANPPSIGICQDRCFCPRG